MRNSFLVAVALATVVGVAGPAAAASGPPDKAAVLAKLTGPSAESYRDWNEARLHPERWSAYHLIWTTDYCTGGPERPAGFDFRLSCQRHDFGYRNYKAFGDFKPNRARLDQAFYADLKRQCATYMFVLRPVCNVLAWTYYQAARRYGAPKVTPTEVQRIESATN
jgi:phospholipase A2-like protein